jgi:hypothetical protein
MCNLTNGLGGDNMLLLLSVETCDALDDHVVRLGGTRGEDNILGICTNEVGNILQCA